MAIILVFAALPLGGAIFGRGQSLGVRAIALLLAAVFVYVLLLAIRRAAWLEGTTVVLRGAFSTRRVDLSTAIVTGASVTFRHHVGHWNDQSHYVNVEVPALVARDHRTGHEIEIPLQDEQRHRMPADQLVALADAMMTGRQPTDPDYQNASALAFRMRQLAANPFPVW
jgi:hypothetical protein